MKKTSILIVIGLLLAGNACKGPEKAEPARESDLIARARAVHDRVLALDAHIDIEVSFFTPERPEKMGYQKLAGLSTMKSGGLDGAFFTAYVEQGALTAEGYKAAHDLALEKIERIHRVAEAEMPKDVAIALTPEDVAEIHKQGKIVAVIGMENGYPIGEDIANVEEFFRRGVRYITLSHVGHNQICDSSLGLAGQPPLHDGLSPFGERVVAEMNRLGVLVDVSHIGKASVLDVMRLSQAPVMASHSTLRDFCGVERMWDEEQLLALKTNGGVFHLVGLRMAVKAEPAEQTSAIVELRKKMGFPEEYWPFFQAFDKAAPETRMEYNRGLEEVDKRFPPADVSEFVNHIDYLVGKIGIDHVGVSSDFYDETWSLDGWRDAGETFNITLELVRRGYTDDEIAKIWSGNTLRVWREVQETARRLGAAKTSPASFPLEEATIAGLQEMMAVGKETSESLVSLYLERIEKIDRTGPALNSVIETNPDALALARELDRERREKGARGPLHGIPILIKDNIDTGDRMETTAGSLALLGSKPAKDAFVVERLREAGAVILGKTNLSEWANFRSSRSTSGWSGRGGQTKNPYALDRNPSGSSSGSAAAVAANLAAAAVGTETDGSIVSPASCCGIVGLKPTVGLVSRSGIIPIAHSQDTAGPMARTVADAATLLGAMTGRDPADPATRADGARHLTDYRGSLKPGGLRGARIGILRAEAFRFPGTLDPILENAMQAMKAEGAEVVDPVEFPTLGKTDEAEYEVLLYEFKADLESYFSGRPGAQVRTLADLIAFNEKNAAREMPFFGQETLEKAVKKGPLTEKAYLEALAQCRELTREKGIDAVLAGNRLDALIVLTNGPAHLTDLVNGDSFSGSSSSPAAVAGYPTITLPAGWVFGLPVGISLIGKAWSEPELIRLAYGLELALKMRKAPRLLPTADLSIKEEERR